MREVEYLIIGQGIAGSALAYQLIKRKKSVMVIDGGHHNSASYVAAGVINPLVLKRLTLSWRAEELLKYCHQFYPQLDTFLSAKNFHPTPLNKLILSNDEELFWQKRWNSAALQGVIRLELEKSSNPFLRENFKKGLVENTAWVDLKLLLKTFREWLKANHSLVETNLDYMSLECHQYEDILFEKVVFCEGASCSKNPFFNHLPFSYNKGELITIKAPTLGLSEMYKKKVFVLPLGNHLYRVGATYERDFEKNYNPVEKKRELVDSFKAIFNCEFEVVEQDSGIRPAVIDRRPLLGRHPVLNNFFLFNGLGSRGCLMAPKLSEELVDFMEEGKPLPKEVELNRTFEANS